MYHICNTYLGVNKFVLAKILDMYKELVKKNYNPTIHILLNLHFYCTFPFELTCFTRSECTVL